MTTTTTRLGLRVTGVVQGVGFRPFVHRLAHELGLAGHVGNDPAGVFAEVEGPEPAVHEFARRVRDDAPPLAHVAEVVVTRLPTDGRAGFVIAPSPAGGPVTTLVPPDVAVCADCRRELFDRDDRRFRHPFITCTNCGPRFTITRKLPYDRPNTTMAGFPMCARCALEYEDPLDRRFHAQPIACPDCGPALRYEPVVPHDLDVEVPRAPEAVVHGSEPALLAAQRCLAAGGVVAVKGVGGFHLACDATDAVAVDRLRTRKQRPHKPFAIMVADVDTARTVARFDDVATAALTSPQRPVVLAPARRGAARPGVVPTVAPGQSTLGVMLPSSPLHELLLAPSLDPDVGVPPVLVMTSGNVSGEPICFADDDVHARLGRLVDGVLTHDRPIHVPCDDGVVTVIDGVAVPVRRSRGDAPLPLRLPCDAPPTLAVGAELKNTVGIAAGRQAWLSQHIGDLGSLETQRSFERAGDQLAAFFGIDPEVVAADPHPGYATHGWARRVHGDRLHHVQHHHAHVAALLAEHGAAYDEVAIGVAFDGTGYGPDGTVWGGEVLLADQRASRRVAHLARVPLPGGDSAVANPANMALAHLWAAGIDWDPRLASVSALTVSQRRVLQQQLTRNVACVPTSSMGTAVRRGRVAGRGVPARQLRGASGDRVRGAGHPGARAPDATHARSCRRRLPGHSRRCRRQVGGRRPGWHGATHPDLPVRDPRW